MSKPAATPVYRRRIPIGGLCAALFAMTLLPSVAVFAASAEPVLQRSERLDIQRLGKISEEERSVLRIERRAAFAGADEAGTVQDMLDNLRRMEDRIGQISRLMLSIPAHKPAAAVVAPPAAAAEPPASDERDTRLMLANLTAAALVLLWWFRRRSSAKRAGPAATIKTEPAASPVVAPGAMPAQRTMTPPTATATSELLATRLSAIPSKPIAGPGANLAPPATSAIQVVDFSLEEAGPESAVHENAGRPTPAATHRPPKEPPRTLDSKIEPTLQLAEIMLSMGLEEGAAKTLVEYIEANPRNAVYHWLKLLGIYRDRGLHQDFKETAEKLRTHFNIQADTGEAPAKHQAPTLEKFSRVAEHVQQIWFQPEECMGYLQRLLEDNRDGERTGFPQSVAEEILLLIEILKTTSGVGQASST